MGDFNSLVLDENMKYLKHVRYLIGILHPDSPVPLKNILSVPVNMHFKCFVLLLT